MEPWTTAITFFLCMQCFSVTGRVWIRKSLVSGGLGGDDFVALVALILSSAFCILCLTIGPLIQSKPVSQMTIQQFLLTMNLILAVILCYLVATMFMKFALGMLILRVIPRGYTRSTKQRWAIYIILIISTIAGIVGCFFCLFMCGSPAKFAENLPLEKGCLPLVTIDGVGYVHGVIVALTDIAIACVAVDFVRGIKLRQGKKVTFTTCILLAFGSFGCLASIVRIPFINSLTGRNMEAYLHLESLAVLSAAELSIGLTCTSIACFKPLLSRLLRGQVTLESPSTTPTSPVRYMRTSTPPSELGMRPSTRGSGLLRQGKGENRNQMVGNKSLVHFERFGGRNKGGSSRSSVQGPETVEGSIV